MPPPAKWDATSDNALLCEGWKRERGVEGLFWPFLRVRGVRGLQTSMQPCYIKIENPC